LKLLIADADKDKERIQKLLQKALNREQAEKMETKATKLAGEAKLTEARAAYEQLAAFLGANELDNAFHGQISERIVKQRKDLEAKIAAVEERKQKEAAQAASQRKEPSRDKPTSSRPAQSQPAKRPEPAPLSPEQVFEKASPAVVYIIVRDKDFKPIGLGSGFFVTANGLVVTNYHVIKGAEFATARLSSGATLFVDGVVATDPSRDLALLKVSGGAFPCLKIAKGALPKVGATVYAIGNPQGLENTFSGGMVSGHREIKQGLTAIQVTTPISPGSSGGPLLNVSGEVVGVTTGGLTGGQNLNFAAPVSGVSALIRKQGKVRTLASAGGGRFDRDRKSHV
jgi:S1-C subfamily serine protease